jgi:hypothetical protein
MFRIPYDYPGFNPGIQIVNLQVGGPSSHMELRPTAPVISPTVYNVPTYGLGNMPRWINQPTQAINVNQYSNPITIDNLQISGVGKNPSQ